jgi:hypothetical protein
MTSRTKGQDSLFDVKEPHHTLAQRGSTFSSVHSNARSIESRNLNNGSSRFSSFFSFKIVSDKQEKKGIVDKLWKIFEEEAVLPFWAVLGGKVDPCDRSGSVCSSWDDDEGDEGVVR